MENNTKDDYTLSRPEVAEFLGVSIQQVNRYRKKGYLTSKQYMPGGRRKYSVSEVQAFKEKAHE